MNYRMFGFNYCTTNFLVLFFSFFLLAVNMTGAGSNEKKYLRINEKITLPEEGLAIKTFKDSKPRPLPALMRLDAKRNNEKIELNIPEELWFHEQCLGYWENGKAGLYIGKLTIPLPDNINRVHNKYTTRKEFDEWKAKQKTDWNNESLKKWLSQFAGAEISSETPEQLKAPRNFTLEAYKVANSNSADDKYKEIFLLTDKRDSNNRLVLVFEASSEMDTGKVAKSVASALKSLQMFQPKKNNNSKQLKLGEKYKINKDWSPEYLASRDRVIDNIKNMEGWWYLTTENYIITSNLKQKKSAKDILEVERIREVFKQYFPIKKPISAVSVIRVFKERDGYLAYVGETLKWSGGVWMPSKKELAVSPCDWAKGLKKRQLILNTLYHEGFHQYFFYALGQIPSSRWFDEGHAQYFEGINFKGGKNYSIELPKYSIKEIIKFVEIGKASEIPELLKKNYPEFYSSEEKDRHQNYTMALALVYFLRKGAPAMKNGNNYSEIPEKYYDALLETKNPQKATEIAWQGVDMAKFQQDFQKFWTSRSLVTRSKSYDPMDPKNRKKGK